MGDVYSQALFTIIVAAGESANDEIPHLRGVSQRIEVRLKERIAFRVFTHAACAINKSKWASRAWTFQEGYLSPRRLIFTDEEVFFLCNHSFVAESSKVSIQHDTLRQAQQSDLWKLFPVIPKKSVYHDRVEMTRVIEKHISEYSKRNLSYESDSLNALIGVLSNATKEDHSFPIRHLWGVPYHGFNTSLAFSLHWKHDTVARRRRAFPSWSWCGWSGAVSFERRGARLTYNSSMCLFSVRLATGERVPLYELGCRPNLALNEMPRDLLITTRIVPCHFVPGVQQTATSSQPYTEFLVDENSFARVPVSMDEPSLASGTRYVGILLERELSDVNSLAMVMLLAKAVDDDDDDDDDNNKNNNHYERVGHVELESEKQYLTRDYVSNGQRLFHDRYNCEPWFCVQFCNVQYVDREGTPYGHFKPDKLHLQPWYRDAEIREICLR